MITIYCNKSYVHVVPHSLSLQNTLGTIGLAMTREEDKHVLPDPGMAGK